MSEVTIVDERPVSVAGRVLRMAEVQDDIWLEGQAVDDPERFLAQMRKSGVKADVFTFVQKLPETSPKYGYHMEWDNFAAVPITSYHDWWERLPQVARKNVRRAEKRGVMAKVVDLDDDVVKGIVEIHRDTPIRQGVPFAHYDKDFEGVKESYGTFAGRNEFIACYYGNEVIGIVKLIYMGKVAGIMQLLAKTKHYDKRPTSVLIAKAVELCEQKGLSYLVYGKYVYGNKTQNSLTEFKGRNGFERIDVPRYYLPLTAWGKVAIKMKLHLGLLGILPSGVINVLRGARSRYFEAKTLLLGAEPAE